MGRGFAWAGVSHGPGFRMGWRGSVSLDAVMNEDQGALTASDFKFV